MQGEEEVDNGELEEVVGYRLPVEGVLAKEEEEEEEEEEEDGQ